MCLGSSSIQRQVFIETKTAKAFAKIYENSKKENCTLNQAIKKKSKNAN